MYQKAAVPCELLFSSADYIVNKTRSSLEANTVNTMYTRMLAKLVVLRHLNDKMSVLFIAFNSN